MSFISILIVILLVDKKRHWIHNIQKDAWFYQLQAYFPQKPLLQFFVSILAPSLVLLALFVIFHNLLWGAVHLVLSVLVLMYALGRGPYVRLFSEYKQAWEDGNKEKLQGVLQALDAKQTVPDDAIQLHIKTRQAFIYQAFTRLFAVLFWFVLLGPVAAFLYRLLKLAEPSTRYSLALEKFMEWPAARLFSFSVALLGNFSNAIGHCKACMLDTQKTANTVISEVALAALDHDMRWSTSRFVVENSERDVAEQAIKEMASIQSLIHRCTIFAVVFIAIVYVLF